MFWKWHISKVPGNHYIKYGYGNKINLHCQGQELTPTPNFIPIYFFKLRIKCHQNISIICLQGKSTADVPMSNPMPALWKWFDGITHSWHHTGMLTWPKWPNYCMPWKFMCTCQMNDMVSLEVSTKLSAVDHVIIKFQAWLSCSEITFFKAKALI